MPKSLSDNASLSLSIVIPVLDESRGVEATLRHVRAIAPAAELIVADGGSGDGTRELAAPFARVIRSAKGRARQMNAGAADSHAEWLLFLHADTKLPEGFHDEILRAGRLGFDAGAFRLRIAGRHPLLPVLAWGANLRSRWFGVAFGDQALFMKTLLFQRLDGFLDLPLMEDYAWCLRLRRERIPLYVSRLTVETSGRRWDELGLLRTWWKMRCLIWSFRTGRDPARLPPVYPDVR